MCSAIGSVRGTQGRRTLAEVSATRYSVLGRPTKGLVARRAANAHGPAGWLDGPVRTLRICSAQCYDALRDVAVEPSTFSRCYGLFLGERARRAGSETAHARAALCRGRAADGRASAGALRRWAFGPSCSFLWGLARTCGRSFRSSATTTAMCVRRRITSAFGFRSGWSGRWWR